MIANKYKDNSELHKVCEVTKDDNKHENEKNNCNVNNN